MALGLVIFDCDGVLVDSDRISLRVQAERIFSGLGLRIGFEDCVHEYLGIGMERTLEILGERLGHTVPEAWVTELEAAVAEAFEQELEAVPGIDAALDRIDLPTCVASSGSQEKMRLTLGLTGLYERFSGRIFSADEVRRGKPAPDLFLHAAAAMGVAPANCVVVEDSPFGIEAARAAGMRSLGFAALAPPERLAAADAVFDSMADLPGLIRD
ncbi:MAG TPA: HAD family hydrolase [Solirubrobacterales bacterium]|nr:HAD family hydrolase [Solirubrobacterales bacterium]